MVAPNLADPASDALFAFDTFPPTTLRVVDHDIAEHTRRAPANKLSMPPTSELTAELDGATAYLGLTSDEILLAALGRTIARTIGDGVARIDVADAHGYVAHAVPLVCATGQQASATEMLRGIHHALTVGPHPAPSPTVLLFKNDGTVPDATISIREVPPEHALELRVYHTAGLLHLDWWYDPTRFDRYTVEDLTEQFRFALIEMTSDALPPL